MRAVGFIDRFDSSQHAPAGHFAPIPGDGAIRVVSESQYQRALHRMRGRCVPGPGGQPSFPVALVPELDDAHDHDNVAIKSEVGRVGCLPSEIAMRYGPTLRALLRDGFEGGTCTALLDAGTQDEPLIGVTVCIASPEDCERHFGLRAADGEPAAGRVAGRHHTEYVEEVKQLRRERQDGRAEPLLLQLVSAMEEEVQARNETVAPWYYEQLAVIYRKRRDLDAEVAILERYAAQPTRASTSTDKLAQRLIKARSLREMRHPAG